MQKHLITFMFLSVLFSAGARDAPRVKPAESTNEEIIEMLRLVGARSYRFDLSELSDREYQFDLFIDEYAMGDKAEQSMRFYMGSNWRERPSDSEDWEKFLGENNPKLLADGRKFLVFENMGIFIVPKNDSTSTVGSNFYGVSAMSMPLKLKTLENAGQPMYDCRPFKIYTASSTNQRIPLLLYSSFWWDEDSNLLRSCMENEFEPDLSSESLKLILHYYVIGIEINESD